MTANRLVLSGLAFAYIIVAAQLDYSNAKEMLRAQGLYFVVYQSLSVLLFCHLLYRPGASAARRLIGLAIDLGFFSYGMHVGGEAFAPLYPIYLWVIFGNGFRFGIPYLCAGSVYSVVTFGGVIATTPFWQEHLGLAAGLIAGLIFLPLYVSTLIRKLSKAKRQAEVASHAKSVFLASISHEFRTPLNAIVGLSSLLRATSLDAEQAEMSETIGQSGRQLLTLINSVLDFSRAEAGRVPIKIIDFDLVSVLSEVQSMLAVEAQRKGLRLSAHCSVRTPHMLIGDKNHLQDILCNLVSNAVKFTERGHVVIAVDAIANDGDVARIRFEITDTGIGIAQEAQARVFDLFTQADETIIDRYGGTGLGLAIVKQLVELQGGTIGVESVVGKGSTFWFEIPYKVNAPVQNQLKDYSSSAPVLIIGGDNELHALVKSYVPDVMFAKDADAALPALAKLRIGGARHPIVLIDEKVFDVMGEFGLSRLAGDSLARAPRFVLLTDKPAAGLPTDIIRSRFATTLATPLNSHALLVALRIAGDAVSVERPGHSAAEVPATRPLSILVAEDNRTNQKVVAKILERAGHRTTIVENGEAALNALSEHEFDLVLMDVNMPVMNGIETTKLYRFGSLGQKHVPIVALTADATDEGGRRCKEAGMDAWITKPIEPYRLIEIIGTVVQGGSKVPQSRPEAIKAIDHVAAGSRIRVARPPAVDFATLEALKDLGGEQFVDDLAVQFLEDASNIYNKLDTIAASGDVLEFRAQIHSLRSAAANIGARGIYEMCRDWRLIASEDFAIRGEAYLKELQHEFERVRAVLEEHLSKRNVAA